MKYEDIKPDVHVIATGPRVLAGVVCWQKGDRFQVIQGRYGLQLACRQTEEGEMPHLLYEADAATLEIDK